MVIYPSVENHDFRATMERHVGEAIRSPGVLRISPSTECGDVESISTLVVLQQVFYGRGRFYCLQFGDYRIIPPIKACTYGLF